MLISTPLQLDGARVVYPGDRNAWAQSRVVDDQLVGEYTGSLVDGDGAQLFAWSEYTAPDLVVDYGTRITPLAFISRWTPAEEIAIRTAAKQDVQVETMIAHVQLAKFIDLTDPRTRASVQALEAAGLLTAGRAIQILDAPVAAAELP